MSVVYFPFTIASPSAMKCLAACFSKTAVFRISDGKIPEHLIPWGKSGFLDIRVPVSGEDKKIADVLRDYKNWAKLHENTPSTTLKHQSDVPFYSDTSISKIRTDIAKRIREKEVSPVSEFDPEDRLFATRLFLALAEEYDLGQLHMMDDFTAIDTMEKKLFGDLKGEADEPDFLSSHPLDAVNEDPGCHMTEERIKAWAILMFQDQTDSGVYVTDSRAVFDFLFDQNASGKKSFTLTDIPVRQREDDIVQSFKEQLMLFLDQLSKNPDPLSISDAPRVPEKQPDETSLTLKVSMMIGVSPHEYFASYLPASMNVHKNTENSQIKHTLICLLEQNENEKREATHRR